MKQDTPIKDLSPEKGFEWFFNEHYSALMYYAFKFVNDRDLAEDAVCIAFERFHTNGIIQINIKYTDEVLKRVCKSWLYTVTRNWILNWMKFENTRHEHEGKWDYETRGVENPIEVAIIRAEVVSQMHKAIKELPTECRNVFVSLFIKGKTVRETAEEFGLSISTIKNQKGRGLKILRKIVTSDGIAKKRRVTPGPAPVKENNQQVDWYKVGKWYGVKKEKKERKKYKLSYEEIIALRQQMPPRKIAEKLRVPVEIIHSRLYAARRAYRLVK